MTKIEWVRNADESQGRTWNPTTGCSHAGTPGCDMCYARRMGRRLAGRYGYPEYPHHFDVTLRPDRLDIPLRRKKPTTYFVCSMSDLFHPDVPFQFLESVWGTMMLANQHVFQILTKRPRRMLEFVEYWKRICEAPIANMTGWKNTPIPVLSNVYLGVSCENQATADERIPLLLQTPAAIRFVSVEPMLEPIQFYDKARRCATLCVRHAAGAPAKCPIGHCYAAEGKVPKGINWVIVGGESGPGARPMDPQWARDIRDQCQEVGVPYFYKQHGAWLHETQFLEPVTIHTPNIVTFEEWNFPKYRWPDGTQSYRVGKKAAGRLLDGREWNEMPEVLDDA